MEIDSENKIEEIIRQIKCPKDNICYKSGFENLSKTKDIDIGVFLYCLNNKSQKCKYLLSYGSTRLCQCSFRIFFTNKITNRNISNFKEISFTI